MSVQRLHSESINPFTPCHGIQILESAKFFPLEFKILSFAIAKTAQRSWNPMTGIQNPSSTDKDLNSVSGIRTLRRGIQNPRLSCIPLNRETFLYASMTKSETLIHSSIF